MTSAPSKRRRGVAYALLTFACYSAADAAYKWLTADYAVMQLVFVTTAFALAPGALVAWRDGGVRAVRMRRPWAVAARTGLLVADLLCAYAAIALLPLADAYALFFVSPALAVALAAALLREAVGPRRALAVAIGFAGALLVVRPGFAAVEWGHLAALGAATVFALQVVALRRIGGGESDAALLIPFLLAVLAVSAVPALLNFTPMPAADVAIAALVGLLFACANLFMIRSYRCAPASVLAPFQYLQLVWGALFGLALFGDVPDVFTIAGGALVVVAGLIVARGEA